MHFCVFDSVVIIYGHVHSPGIVQCSVTKGDAVAAAANSSALPTISSPTASCRCEYDGRVRLARRRTNQPEQAKDTAEDLYNEDLHEQIGIRSIRERSGRAGDADADTAEQIAHSDSQATPEESEPCTGLLRSSRTGSGRRQV